jgi:hypothetical protein
MVAVAVGKHRRLIPLHLPQPVSLSTKQAGPRQIRPVQVGLDQIGLDQLGGL